MKSNLFSAALGLMLASMFSLADAQVPAGRSACTTMFEEFFPGVVTLSNGHKSKQSQLNIFLRESTLVFKRGNQIMEAEMPTIQAVEIAGHQFINVRNILAEVIAVDSLSDIKLVKVRTVDVEAMRHEALDNSTVDHLSLTSIDALNVSRRFDGENTEPYLLMDTYYYLLADGKQVQADERSVKDKIGKKKRKDLEALVEYNFSWGDPNSLVRVFPLLRK